jgi:arylsulfatase A-like enzyme
MQRELGAASVSEPAAPTRLVLRAGDCLLDLAPLARLLDLPSSNLPAPIEALTSGPVYMHSPTLLAGAWSTVSHVPKTWAALLEQHGNPNLWRARPPLRVVADSERPSVRVDGQPALVWSLETRYAGETIVWWDAPGQALLAVGELAPASVAIDAWTDPSTEFGEVEPRLLSPGVEPSARALLGRHELDELSLRSMLLPAPAAWELSIDELAAQRLELSVGLIDRAWQLSGDVLHRTHRLTDGVQLAIDVQTPDGRVDRVWSLELDAQSAGDAFVEQVVDLSAYVGKALTLRLLTEPGPSGSRDFDYAVWGGLRLRGGQRKVPRRPHVVLIDVDTLRADRLGVYDPDSTLTPQLDAWAEQSATIFSDAVSDASWTLPSTVSMLTGLAVHQHGVERATGMLDESVPTLARHLRRAGYETLAIASGGYLRPLFGLAQGFDRYRTADPENLDFSEALGWLQQRDSERPFFLFVHTYAVHAPFPYDADMVDPDYDGPYLGLDVEYGNLIDPFREGRLELTPGDRAYVEALYGGLVRRMDAACGELLARLYELVEDEPLLVIFTSDHGEAFFEHEVLGHGQEIYQELLAVPLLIAFPDGPGGEPLRGDPAALVDIVPTVLDVVGLPIPEGLAGRSLLKRQAEHRVRVAHHLGQLEQRAVISAGLKLIERWPPGATEVIERELYDLGADPGEQHPLAWEDDPRVAALQHRLSIYQTTHPALEGRVVDTAEIDDAAMRQLRALGYLGDAEAQERR